MRVHSLRHVITEEGACYFQSLQTKLKILCLPLKWMVSKCELIKHITKPKALLLIMIFFLKFLQCLVYIHLNNIIKPDLSETLCIIYLSSLMHFMFPQHNA